MNIYVSSLSFGVSSSALGALFEAFGEVSSANVINDKFTQKSRGFGFVEMPNKEEAEKAIQELNGTTMDGRTINVTEAQERAPRKPSPFKNERNKEGYSSRW